MNKQHLRSIGKALREGPEKNNRIQEAIGKLRKDIATLDSLLREAKLLGLYEEEIPTKPASEVWDENKDSASEYISNVEYFVRRPEGSEKFEVTVVQGTERKPFAVLSRQDLDAGFTPIRPNQTPDAEGYTQYRDLKEVIALKYTGDTVKVDVGADVPALLKKGDYLIRKAQGNNFAYEVKPAKDFEEVYTKK